jgi:aldehyde:ferredoxin oxidoreductase
LEIFILAITSIKNLIKTRGIHMSKGYWGKILFVDLSSGKIHTEEPSQETYRQYLGGYGLGVRYLYERIPQGADPLGPENMLAFLPGLLTGSGAQFSGRFMVAARSPLTGAWGDSNCGGNFGPALKGAGWDAVFVNGQSSKPVYLMVDGDQVEIRDASELWGLDVRQTEEKLHSELGKDVRVACIGLAGEKLSLMAGIVNDDGRIAARCGLGAVMGSKKLKAVVARGKTRPAIANPVPFKSASSRYLQLFRRKTSTLSGKAPKIVRMLLPLLRRLKIDLSSASSDLTMDSYRRYGTSVGTSILVELGDTPVKNWTGIGYRDFPVELSEGLSDNAVIKPLIKSYACHSCPLACGGIVNQPDGGISHRSEYETLASFGPLTMNADLDVVMRCNHICNMAGLDTVSTGASIAFAMEGAEKGWLPAELADELPLEWGNGETILELTKRIVERAPGLGEWLADGVRKASESLGPECRSAAVHAGGQELSMHRGLYEPGLAVGYALDPAPGRHTSNNSGNGSTPAFAPFFALFGRKPAARYDYAEVGITQAISMPLHRAVDSLGLCQFSLIFGKPPFMDWLKAATGWDVDEAEFFRMGKRIQVMRHAFNHKHGLPARFELPARERGEPPQSIGPLARQTLDMDSMAAGYFDFLGIHPQTGFPLVETVKELDLGTILQ